MTDLTRIVAAWGDAVWALYSERVDAYIDKDNNVLHVAGCFGFPEHALNLNGFADVDLFTDVCDVCTKASLLYFTKTIPLFCKLQSLCHSSKSTEAVYRVFYELLRKEGALFQHCLFASKEAVMQVVARTKDLREALTALGAGLPDAPLPEDSGRDVVFQLSSTDLLRQDSDSEMKCGYILSQKIVHYRLDHWLVRAPFTYAEKFLSFGIARAESMPEKTPDWDTVYTLLQDGLNLRDALQTAAALT